MNEVVMLEAALFQLRAGAEEVDPMFGPRLDLCLSVLANAVAAAREGVNASLVSDIEFSLNDLAATVDELSADDAERLSGAVAMMREDVERLKQQTSLDPATVSRIRAFQGKLRTRRSAIERQTYRPEGSPEEALPHPPVELRTEALPIHEELAAAGFATPELDTLIADPDSTRFHSLTAILDELEVIAG
jgi:hypothetical protein